RTEHRRITADDQHFTQLHDRADIAGDLANFKHIIRNDAVLPAAGFDDCEHRSCPSCSYSVARANPARLLVSRLWFRCSSGSFSGSAKTNGARNPAPGWADL